ncbi:hypothetical protein IWQ51_005798 [Labrenzia sp. EL_142]|nr:hypothetical protein [Labrenzia sp. EL_142]
MRNGWQERLEVVVQLELRVLAEGYDEHFILQRQNG